MGLWANAKRRSSPGGRETDAPGFGHDPERPKAYQAPGQGDSVRSRRGVTRAGAEHSRPLARRAICRFVTRPAAFPRVLRSKTGGRSLCQDLIEPAGAVTETLDRGAHEIEQRHEEIA